MANPVITISNAAAMPIPAGTVITFPVTLNEPATTLLNITFTTLAGPTPGGASAGEGDYVGVSNGLLQIPAGTQTAEISITIKKVPPATAQIFYVKLLTAPNAQIAGTGTATGTIQPLPPIAKSTITVGASPLIIKTGGTWGNVASTVLVETASATDNVVLAGLKYDSLICQQPCNLSMFDTLGTGLNNPTYTLAVYRFVNFLFEHNELHGPGSVIQDASGLAQTAYCRYSKFVNIAGPTVSGTRQKRSAMQFANLHLPGLEISYCQTQSVRGQSAMEDAFSFMKSGGTQAARAKQANLMMDGNWAYPIITDVNWKTGYRFSGSGIMAYDPGGSSGETQGGYTDCHDNIVIDCENQAIACAGSHDISIFNNLVVKDNTGSPFGSEPFQWWNWGIDPNQSGTEESVFATNCEFYGNSFNWLVEGKLIAPVIDSKVIQTKAPNVQVTTTAAEARELWNQKIAGVVIGIRAQIVA